MTYEEALRWTDDSLSQGKVLPEQESYAYMGVVKIALEKQIPKKPDMTVEENYLEEYTFYHCDCPTCGKFLEGGRTRHPHHCPCGQAIDWSADEET